MCKTKEEQAQIEAANKRRAALLQELKAEFAACNCVTCVKLKEKQS